MRRFLFAVTAGVLTLTILALPTSAQRGTKTAHSKTPAATGPGIKVRPGKGAVQVVHTKGHSTAPKGNAKNGPGGRKPPTPKQQQALRKFVDTANLPAGEKSAVNKVISGQQLSAQDRTALSGLLMRNPPELTTEAREALNQALNDDMERQLVSFSRRYLRVHNDTADKLRMWLQYQTLTVKQTWVWYPAPPWQSKQGVSYNLEPSAVVDLRHEKWRVNASKGRIWARSAAGKEWGEYRDQDLWLVPETDERGGHRYYAAQHETFTFTFQH
jgi:hypothetical protein